MGNQTLGAAACPSRVCAMAARRQPKLLAERDGLGEPGLQSAQSTTQYLCAVSCWFCQPPELNVCMYTVTSRGMCAPTGSQPVWKEPTMTTTRIWSKQLSVEHCSVLCIAPSTPLCSTM